ncbi:MAG: ABC transporter ATP-binding protein [Brevefilum sp.]|nr:ABC transporter ATP-binding protein [Brevefilum sp.]MDT8382232.1 ABC transporter ATP-binding protein [Brevefilum sp.]MDW7755038.1 ABC transporter ATP-binding protein [Brevefilum sp.]
MDGLIKLENLRTRFHTEDGIVNAVNGVSYEMAQGEVLGVVGESGCGKSVHALSIMRLIQIPPGEIYDGEIWFDGRDLLTLDEKEIRQVRGRDIAMVFQDPMSSLNPVYTIGFQIVEALTLHTDLNKKAAKERAAELLSLVGIPEPEKRLDNYPHQFSGGMRQRAMIAMALSCEPKLLIADEPTTALDVTIQAQIVDLVIRLKEELGMAVMWITHDLGIVAEMAHKINVMYAGYIIERGSAQDIFKRTKHPYTMGLLGSLPKIDDAPGTKLFSIPGLPPDLVKLPKGCPFFARCAYRKEQCKTEMPPLEEAENESHIVACWRWREIQAGEIQ